ncbi:MAG: CCA tRNA nucleotidyltransferase, partial [Amylibacter sp.]
LGGEGIQAALRLSKQETQLLTAMKSVMSEACSARVTGYKLGEKAGLDAALVLHAHLGTSLPDNLIQELKIGADAKFPIAAVDFADQLEGPALGACLKSLEAAWIRSDLRLSKDELLKVSRSND